MRHGVVLTRLFGPVMLLDDLLCLPGRLGSVFL